MRSTRPILLATFLSGAGALALQVTWTRRLAISLGHELPAWMGVITAFFLGLALGGVVGDWLIRRSSRVARLAMLVEVVIAAWALATLPLIDWLNLRLPVWRGTSPGSWGMWGWAFAIPLLALLPATVAIGATFPIAGRLLAQGKSIRPWGMYYAVNSAGACVGTLAALCWWQPFWGYRWTTGIAAGLHACAALVFGYALNAIPPTSPSQSVQADPGTRGATFSLLGPIALSGLLAMGFEIVSVRLLQMVLGGTIYSYATMLAVWLLGTCLGAAVWSRRPAWPWRFAPWLIGLAVALAALELAKLPAAGQAMALHWGSGFGAGTAFELLAVGAIFLPATFLMGAFFSELLHAVVRGGGGAGHAVAANTLAGAAAPVIFGAALFPWLGSRQTWLVLVVGYVLLARWCDRGRNRPVSATVFSVMACAVCAWLLVPSDLSLAQGPPGARRVWNREGAGDTVSVWENSAGNRVLTVDNRFSMGGTSSTNAAARQAHLPLLMHPNPRRALFLGLGTGLSFAAAGGHPGLTADGVELVPQVVEALPQFGPYNQLGPGLTVVTADARTFVRSMTNRYDVIVADLFHPDRDGAAWLYTHEHFSALRTGLLPDGIACQWLPWFQLDVTAREAVLRAWAQEFPRSQVWLLRWTSVDVPVIGLVGWKDSGDAGRPPRLLSDLGPELRDRLRGCGLYDDWQVRGCWLGSVEELIPAHSPVPANSDDRPVVGWMAARHADRARQQYLDDLLGRLDGLGVDAPAAWALNPEGWRGFREARNDYLRALAAAVRGEKESSESWLWASARASAEFPSAYSHLLNEAMADLRKQPALARERLRRLAEVRPEKTVAQELMKQIEHL